MKLSKAYEPNTYEPEIYALWETSGAFAPTGQGEPYSIVMPPPNANANLHVGHSLEIIKDIIIRYQRMNGRDAVYIPGADHAGFETWVVFEKALEREGKSRFDFDRETLYQMTWDFVEKNRGNMELQIRALGVSCDWPSFVFSLDKKVVDTVYGTFKRMWDDGFIYRGKRLVNYCTKHRTSFADIEVSNVEETVPLYYIKYGPFELATTRPETKFGDTAVAVHPSDKRYKDWVGKTITVQGVNGDFEVQVIADEMVDLNFGTGVVKITPAHSFDDFEVAQRHNLPMKQAIGFDGKMTAVAGRFEGLPVLEARTAVVKAMEEMGLIIKIDKHYKTRIGHCYKCGTVIEPLPMEQWFVNVRPLAQRAKKAVQNGEIKFVPSQKADELIRYYDEMRDWNISRQIPWGIPIPAFQNEKDPDDWVFDTRVDQNKITVNGKTYIRDEDTFDTWFSSGQWPYITTDYLKDGELARFYPTTLMENGTDLLRPWDSRMIMLGLYVTDKVPFKNLYFHGMVTDEHGRKMSKSKGNVLNPMDIVNEYGSDALRIGIVMNRSAGQAQAFSTASVIAGRNFCNKLWNVARFIEGKLEVSGAASTSRAGSDVTTSASTTELRDDGREGVVRESSGAEATEPITIADHWILRQLDHARRQLDKHIKNYHFAEAVDTIYHVVWDNLADWFIEASKTDARPEFLRYVLDITLRLAHPFAPFVTETIWTTLQSDNSLLISQQWPEKLIFDKAKAAEFDQITDLVSEVRLITADLPAKGKYGLLYGDDTLIAENTELIQSLAGLKSITQVEQGRGVRLAVAGHEAVWLDISENLLYEHQTRLETRLVAVQAEIANLEKRLLNQGYVANAPAHLVEETRAALAEKQSLAERLRQEINNVKS